MGFGVPLGSSTPALTTQVRNLWSNYQMIWRFVPISELEQRLMEWSCSSSYYHKNGDLTTSSEWSYSLPQQQSEIYFGFFKSISTNNRGLSSCFARNTTRVLYNSRFRFLCFDHYLCISSHPLVVKMSRRRGNSILASGVEKIKLFGRWTLYCFATVLGFFWQ